jgi:hypothetical protein
MDKNWQKWIKMCKNLKFWGSNKKNKYINISHLQGKVKI